MTKIVRTPTKATGGITPEEKLALNEHAKLWISRVMRTDPIEPNKIIPAIKVLYKCAGLKEPRVVIVPSPLVMAFAYGASAVAWGNKNDATNAATDVATNAATDAATYTATYDATRTATRAATDAATRAATDAATRAATDAATYTATNAATNAATYDATRNVAYDATHAATDAATYTATYTATYAATYTATDAATRNVAYDATRNVAYDATRNVAYAATDAATDAATYTATYTATRAATYTATRAATDTATRDATDAATGAATYAATGAATYEATDTATRDATDAATYDVTRIVTHAATYDAVDSAIKACFEISGMIGLQMANKWNNSYQGGNMWGAFDCYLTSLRDILGLKLPEFEKYKFWEEAAIHGGFRVLHPKFCIVSDFPEFIRVDEQNRSHCENGPSHRWRDGWSLYHWHGIQIPGEWIENKTYLTPKIALSEKNMEKRQVAIQIIGWARILKELDAKTIDQHDDPHIGELLKVDIPDLGRQCFVRVMCGTRREFAIAVPPETKTAIEAQAWMRSMSVTEFMKNWPEIRT